MVNGNGVLVFLTIGFASLLLLAFATLSYIGLLSLL